MKVYQLDGDEDSGGFIFATREAAETFGGPNAYITEHEVYEAAPPEWTYWHVGASVYPDGTFTEWQQEHKTRGEVTIPPVDDHLNRRSEPWDGHTQGHCGEHVSLFGTDLEALKAAFGVALNAAIARQDGECHSRYHGHQGVVDGRTVYESGFMKARRAYTGEDVDPECWPYAEHDFGSWSDWRDVGSDTRNRQRICKRCCTFEISALMVPSTGNQGT